MKKFEQLINRSFEATKKRGCINKDTTCPDFNDKLFEEVREVECEYVANYVTFGNDVFLKEELADVAAVAFNYIMFLGGDPIAEFEKVVLKNEKRADGASEINKLSEIKLNDKEVEFVLNETNDFKKANEKLKQAAKNYNEKRADET